MVLNQKNNLLNFFSMIVALMFISVSVYASTTINIKVDKDSEIEVTQYASQGENLLIILPSEYGVTDGLISLAKNINKQNTEVWIADPFSSFFLIAAPSSLQKIPLAAYLSIIKKAQKTNKKIYLFSDDKGSAVLLNTVHKLQLLSKKPILGAILVSPDLYEETPNAGNKGVLLPIASSTNLALELFIPEKSTLNLHVDETINALKEGGSDVHIEKIKNVRNRFFFREDATQEEKNYTNKFADIIVLSMTRLEKYSKNRDPMKIKKTRIKKVKKHVKELKKYTGKSNIKDFKLKDLNGITHSLSKYTGSVILLNFWASWCPPCVKEMPSMSNLSNNLKKESFKILAINLGESSADISKFIKKNKVNFTVLLDPDQIQPKRWKVFAFPTSYIIDKKGKIRYSIAGGFDWDTKETTDILKGLANEN